MHVLLKPLPAVRAHEQTRAVEKPALRTQPRAAHARIASGNLVGNHKRRTLRDPIGCGRAVNVPGVFAVLYDLCGHARAMRREAVQTLGKLAHQITARNPHRQTNALDGGRLRQRQRHMKRLRARLAQAHAIVRNSHNPSPKTKTPNCGAW